MFRHSIAAVIATMIAAGALAMPAAARLWKPTPQQQAQDYTVINHNKGNDGRVVMQWLASTTNSSAVMQQVLDKYVVISVVHSRTVPGGGTSWDDVQGIAVTDSDGVALKEVPQDAVPPTLVGLFAQVDAMMRQGSQGKARTHWGVYEAGNAHACAKGKLSLTYDGETYTWDTPLPGCPKS
ncbi:MAG: hypothetical protein JWN16_844 [Alphaproteobacteria bacterium]|nr:hypothetical protein [Alphaproteobacteria bacterium]